MTPFFAHVVGCEPGEQVVVNGCGEAFCKRPSDGSPLIQTNHFCDEELAELNPNDLEEYDTLDRYAAIARRIRRQSPRGLDAAMNLMRRWPVTHEATMQSMALCPARHKLILRVRV
jgi:hypothetical protein